MYCVSETARLVGNLRDLPWNATGEAYHTVLPPGEALPASFFQSVATINLLTLLGYQLYRALSPGSESRSFLDYFAAAAHESEALIWNQRGIMQSFYYEGIAWQRGSVVDRTLDPRTSAVPILSSVVVDCLIALVLRQLARPADVLRWGAEQQNFMSTYLFGAPAAPGGLEPRRVHRRVSAAAAAAAAAAPSPRLGTFDVAGDVAGCDCVAALSAVHVALCPRHAPRAPRLARRRALRSDQPAAVAARAAAGAALIRGAVVEVCRPLSRRWRWRWRWRWRCGARVSGAGLAASAGSWAFSWAFSWASSSGVVADAGGGGRRAARSESAAAPRCPRRARPRRLVLPRHARRRRAHRAILLRRELLGVHLHGAERGLRRRTITRLTRGCAEKFNNWSGVLVTRDEKGFRLA